MASEDKKEKTKAGVVFPNCIPDMHKEIDRLVQVDRILGGMPWYTEIYDALRKEWKVPSGKKETDFKSIWKSLYEVCGKKPEIVETKNGKIEFLNPLYDIYMKIIQEKTGKYSYPCSTITGGLRQELVQCYCFGVPNAKVIKTFVENAPNGKIVELGAATGYWSYQLKEFGADMIAIDICPDQKEFIYYNRCGLYHPVVKCDMLDFVVSGKADNSALLFCWPEYEMYWHILKTISKWKGNVIYYVGEESTMTADIYSALVKKEYRTDYTLEDMFKTPSKATKRKRKEIEKEVKAALSGTSWELKEKLELPNWRGIANDCAYIIVRK